MKRHLNLTALAGWSAVCVFAVAFAILFVASKIVAASLIVLSIGITVIESFKPQKDKRDVETEVKQSDLYNWRQKQGDEILKSVFEKKDVFDHLG